MKKIGTITFHGAHNYGSNLQAYALQQFIKTNFKDEFEYNIINFRTEEQMKLYDNFFEKKDYKSCIKQILFHKYRKQIYDRDKLFEDFINKDLNVTTLYKSEEELDKISNEFDYYICGSDQIWNLMIADSSWAYFLEFAKSGKKISYAPSFGNKNQVLDENQKERLKKNLVSFDNISVRDEWAKNFVYEISHKDAEILIDPTMLLSYDEWMELIGYQRIVEDKYIFLYDIKGDKETLEIAKKIARKENLKIITPLLNKKRIFDKKINNKFDCGPIEFLNLIKNAEYVVTSSFHGCVFSVLLRKKFMICGFEGDNRISTFVKRFNIEQVLTNLNNVENIDMNVDFEHINSILDRERRKSLNFLDNVLH